MLYVWKLFPSWNLRCREFDGQQFMNTLFLDEILILHHVLVRTTIISGAGECQELDPSSANTLLGEVDFKHLPFET